MTSCFWKVTCLDSFLLFLFGIWDSGKGKASAKPSSTSLAQQSLGGLSVTHRDVSRPLPDDLDSMALVLPGEPGIGQGRAPRTTPALFREPSPSPSRRHRSFQPWSKMTQMGLSFRASSPTSELPPSSFIFSTVQSSAGSHQRTSVDKGEESALLPMAMVIHPCPPRSL